MTHPFKSKNERTDKKGRSDEIVDETSFKGKLQDSSFPAQKNAKTILYKPFHPNPQTDWILIREKLKTPSPFPFRPGPFADLPFSLGRLFHLKKTYPTGGR